MSARGFARRLAAIATLFTPAAAAHGLAQRYDLPIPLELYVTGAALTVAVSCLMLALYVRVAAATTREDIALVESGEVPPLVQFAVALLRTIFVAAFILVIVAGLLGNPNPFRNIAPIGVWAAWWVGMAYVSALVGDLWKIANPLETIFAAMERAGLRSRALEPPALAPWCAVILFWAFLWMEMVWEGSDRPASLATAILAYSLAAWIGMFLIGRERWMAQCDPFARVFGVLARFSPSEVEIRDRRVVRWRLRPYAVGLLAREPASRPETALILLILAAVSFDGFMETPAWVWLVDAAAGIDEASADDSIRLASRTLGLVAAPLLFAALYAVFCRIIAWAGGRAAAARIAGLFACTLVPIAIAYQVAHYLSFLAMAGQYLIPLASDPLGRGWDLFGTANYFVRVVVLDARTVWYVSVAAIVAGHVAALYLGHRLALREFAARQAAIRSQWPMLVLMVGYTMLSLWIIAQPIVNNR